MASASDCHPKNARHSPPTSIGVPRARSPSAGSRTRHGETPLKRATIEERVTYDKCPRSQAGDKTDAPLLPRCHGRAVR